jgi:hypothetical protein
MQSELFPTSAADHHRLLERMANAKISDAEAREILSSEEAHRQFIAALCAGMQFAAGKRP